MNYNEKTINSQLVYQGTIFNVERLTVELPNGKHVPRDIVRNPGASAVVPFTDDGRVILVTQYRKPNDRVYIEIPAGKLDKGEDPAVCALRELREETGYSAKNLKKIMEFNPAPAFADEILHIYVATGLTEGDCHPDEDEFISAKAYDIEEVLTMIEKGEICDGKTVSGILLALRLLNK